MNKYIKECVRICNSRGMKRKEIAWELGISIRTVYKYLKDIREEQDVNYTKELKEIFEIFGCQIKTNDNENIMTKYNPNWDQFCNLLSIRLDFHPCNSETLTQSKFVLELFFPNINVEKSLEYFRNSGGYCDCEVLMNVR